MKKQMDVRALTILALMTALLIVFSFTPIGSIHIAMSSTSSSVIPCV